MVPGIRKILLADDHIVVRAGLKSVLQPELADWVIHEAENGEEIFKQVSVNTYDIMIMDINMPNTDTLDIMQLIRIKYPQTKILIFSLSSEKIYAKRFLKEGAYGFVSKEAPLEELKKALHLAINGRKYISPALMEILADDSINDAPANPFDRLSKREFEIGFLLLSGEPLYKISSMLHLKASTIGTHKSRVFEKLGVTNILQLKELAQIYQVI